MVLFWAYTTNRNMCSSIELPIGITKQKPLESLSSAITHYSVLFTFKLRRFKGTFKDTSEKSHMLFPSGFPMQQSYVQKEKTRSVFLSFLS
jgi:hypothetical protein